MSEILLCNRALSPQAFENQCGIDIGTVSALSCTKPIMAAANTPYLVGDNSSVNRNILNQLTPEPVAKSLTNLSLFYGGDNVVALAEMTEKLKDYNLGLIGASTSVYAGRISGFAGAVQDYEVALMKYRQAVTSNSSMKNSAEKMVNKAFQKMQGQFRNELNAVTAQIKAKRGIPLNNAKRSINIAKSSRNVAKLDVTSQIQANKIVRFSKQAKILGNGLAVIDFASRVGNVQNSYQAGEKWERNLFIESSSFATSAVTGSVAVNVGGAALTFLVAATPIGWIGLIIGG